MKSESIQSRELLKAELFLKASLMALVDALASESRKLEELLEVVGSGTAEQEGRLAYPAA